MKRPTSQYLKYLWAKNYGDYRHHRNDCRWVLYIYFVFCQIHLSLVTIVILYIIELTIPLNRNNSDKNQ